MTKGWQIMELSSLRPGKIIACDPSLTALGLVYLEVTPSEVVVRGAEKLSTAPTDRKGWDDTFYRTSVMQHLIAACLSDWDGMGSDVVAVHEAPPVGQKAGSKSMMRTEVPILTSYAFRMVTVEEFGMTLEAPVTSSAHRHATCGNGRATKKEHHDFLKQTYFPYVKGSNMITNEATRDAFSVGLYAAWRRT